MALRDIAALLKTQEEASEASQIRDWEALEGRMNLKLPRDYKSFIESYGAGTIAEFIRVFSPFSQDSYMNLLECSQSITEMFRNFKWGPKCDAIPFQYYPNVGGLLPWGNDENGNYLFWATEGSPSKWPTVVADVRGPRWQKFDCSMTIFLAEVLTRKTRCKLWPRNFPGKHKEFMFNPFD